MLKTILKAVFKIILLLIVLAIVAAGAYVAVHYFDIPKETVIVVLVLSLAVILAIVFAYRFIVIRRQRKQIQTIVNLDNNSISDDEFESSLIENRWARAISIMRQSYLGKSGNPIYALPWYMVIGRSGAGKSSAVMSCGLNALKTDLDSPEGISTQNCDWHFFREAVVMDTAGRYAIPINEAQDLAEWRRFINRLARYRRRETLNGLVVAISSEFLYDTGEHLLDEARTLRTRIDEVMQILGHKFPVYLMVTKMDLPLGMDYILDKLPESIKEKSLGVQIQSLEKDLLPLDVLIQQAVESLQERLKKFFLYADPIPTEEATPHRLLAWEEFRAMMPALTTYAKELFSSNPYQETPLFRGIFLSSARRTQKQKQTAFPALKHLLASVFKSKTEALGGIFLKDFFREVLPFDRALNAPIAEYMRWQSKVRNTVYAIFTLFFFGLNLLFYFSYEHNVSILNRITHMSATSTEVNMATKLAYFEDLFREEEKIENEIKNYKLPLLGYSQGEQAHQIYSDRLGELFSKNIVNVAMKGLEEKRVRLTEKSNDLEFYNLTSDLIWKHDLISAAIEGKSFHEMLDISPMPNAMMQELGLQNVQELSDALTYCMTRAIYNVKDKDYLEQLLRYVRSSLDPLPGVKRNSYHWVIHRATSMHNLTPIRGSDFWLDTLGNQLSDLTLDPIYTKEGMKATFSYLQKLNIILDEDNPSSREEFMAWYAKNYVQEWFRFVNEFADRGLKLAMRPAQDETLYMMASFKNPYYNLLSRVADELYEIEPYLKSKPDWLYEVQVLNRAIQIEIDKEKKTTPTLREKVQTEATKIYRDVLKRVDPNESKLSAHSQELEEDLDKYIKQLDALARYGSHTDMGFNAVKEAMPSEKNPKNEQSPLIMAYDALGNINALINPTHSKSCPLLRLSEGPAEYFKATLINATACHVQELWEGEVLEQTGALAPSQLQQELFADQTGIVRKFTNDTLGVLLNKTLHGYAPEKVLGTSVPFTKEFIGFINTGVQTYRKAQDEYNVEIAARPTHVNPEAFEVPYSVELSFLCAKDKQTLVNLNTPVSKIFNWKPGVCGDTLLKIRFKDFSLDVSYAGENGFVNFLEDFQFGSKKFAASDFKTESEMLSRRGVKEITVNFNIQGASDLIGSRRFVPGAIPFTAATCQK